ncbi:MAG: hypothetical protein FIB08_06660 [Candidatus Methanoperedens sp.]|nr:hypothetical protein [Candidatus Methanoperedens sp.]
MDIKIIICFTILFFPPLVSADSINDVWAAQSSGFIRANESLTYEKFLIKAKPLDDEKASITVYRDQTRISQQDFSINDFHEYSNIKVTLLGIKGEYSWIGISRLENRDVWKSSGIKVLKWGEKYNVGSYTISADTFTSDSVSLVISNSTMAETKVFEKNSTGDYGNLRIFARDINPEGFVELEFLTIPSPVTEAGIFTDKEEYAPDEPILVTVNLSVDNTLNIAGIALENSANMQMQPSMVSLVNVSGTRFLSSRIAQFPANSSGTITASVEMRDYLGNVYITTTSKVIHTLPVISIRKIVPTDTDEKNVTVELLIHNAGPTEESVSIYDTVYENETLDQKHLTWLIKIKPGGSANISYITLPQKIGQYIFPPAVAKWKNQSSASREMTMTVHGPLIEVTKSAIKRNTRTDVKLLVSNTGDRPALVNVSDEIPEGYPVLEGIPEWSGLLEGGENTILTYSLQGSVENLPAAQAVYRDIRGVFKQAQSNTIKAAEYNEPAETVEQNTSKNNDINMKNNNIQQINARPMEMLLFMIVSFMAIAGIISSVAMAAYISIRSKKRQ